ncbi:hypothetical protein SAMN05192551_103131 [Tindallia magadiensis]|uniref:Uncharacterized protein n=1 Tax=Tindallia magadiensis TaxID=69895 RepID=A0A1I3D3V1_9FIRM|nr:hypothetical protein [Tindallia magadiensis]SFH81171.1 hypothetical protein SAMN05192551_103131 [Tindallia magadiensis]
MLIKIPEEHKKKNKEKFSAKKKYEMQRYKELTSRYQKTHTNITYAELAESQQFQNKKFLLLRHDIDHDYETAIKMAEWENKNDLRANYCLLHSAWYYGEFQNGRYNHTEELVQLCTKIKDLGHEVSLHNNLLTLALKENVDYKEVLKRELDFFTSLGVQIQGTSSHGDRLCRELNYRNYEIFKEAVGSEYGGNRLITYNEKESEVEVGKASMSELNLLYEAYDIWMDTYISDAGGTLKTVKNMEQRHGHLKNDHEKANSIVGILTHPIWWNF